MDEYIKRSQAIKELTNAYEYEYPTASGAFDEFATTIVPNVLRNIPAADVVEVVHSKWIKRNNERRCPICDFFYMTNGTTVYNLCPMCGAKMDARSKSTLSEATRQTVLDSFMKGSED